MALAWRAVVDTLMALAWRAGVGYTVNLDGQGSPAAKWKAFAGQLVSGPLTLLLMGVRVGRGPFTLLGLGRGPLTLQGTGGGGGGTYTAGDVDGGLWN